MFVWNKTQHNPHIGASTPTPANRWTAPNRLVVTSDDLRKRAAPPHPGRFRGCLEIGRANEMALSVISWYHGRPKDGGNIHGYSDWIRIFVGKSAWEMTCYESTWQQMVWLSLESHWQSCVQPVVMFCPSWNVSVTVKVVYLKMIQIFRMSGFSQHFLKQDCHWLSSFRTMNTYNGSLVVVHDYWQSLITNITAIKCHPVPVIFSVTFNDYHNFKHHHW